MYSASALPRPIAISLGDPAGIGPEVTAKAWEARDAHTLPPFFAVGDSAAIAAVWQGPVAMIGDPIEADAVFGKALPCLQVADAGEIIPGQPSIDGARCAFQALEAATGLVRAESASALVTAPVSKSQLSQVGFTHPGQTEFVAERCGVSRGNVVMMLAGPSLRVVPLTIHIPYTEVPEALTAALIRSRALATARGLKRLFGIENPRLAMAGLNPHAGENGMLGTEETTLIAPVLEQLREDGLDISGPHSPDALFTPRARALYDAALCCYHDQALIPIKALDFDEGVNITLGLPIVRTSPDHGTAFDLAGKDQAHPGAMIAAIRMAQQAELNRRAWVDPCQPS
ncbi:4-hydroxythreonine-4-phosphate dehydrogenase PdxA [Sphingobium sp. B12D2B]|uniref:4-hydroxythreonine-4-phosphate dehydrogenase PdxA n=1 Tax=Sphingobium sp. B12D2B TaxID=2940577 RepID=UPI0022252201|nr:4-hydroxythreonine-4-phosphate dehydrogenase PdxA [Sphingobium sp. B12D2B]MCW2350228.1 4-hydroxythreonine-4-phosphate dehydrogenase [Sphingobium sp. B12D2B]